MRDTLSRVIQLASEESGIPISELSAGSAVDQDIRISGDDVTDFAETLANEFGEQGYDGPAPPAGDPPHRYFFRLFALDRPLELPPDADPHDVVIEARDNSVAAGTLIGLYAR